MQRKGRKKEEGGTSSIAPGRKRKKRDRRGGMPLPANEGANKPNFFFLRPSLGSGSGVLCIFESAGGWEAERCLKVGLGLGARGEGLGGPSLACEVCEFG